MVVFRLKKPRNVPLHFDSLIVLDAVMLPDYPTLKKEMEEAFLIFMRKRMDQYAPLVQQAPWTRQFEGDASVLTRSTGSEEPIEFKSTVGQLRIPVDEIASLSVHDVLARIDAVAKEMASGMERDILNSLDEQLDKHGRTVDAGGAPLSASLILEALRGMSISFDEAGEPEMPSFVIHPDLNASMRRAATEIQENPKYKQEYKELIALKREEWVAEQASRKLVG